MRVWITSSHDLMRRDGKQRMMNSPVVIVDGVILKNRDGVAGAHVGGAVYVWEEEICPESGPTQAMNGWEGKDRGEDRWPHSEARSSDPRPFLLGAF